MRTSFLEQEVTESAEGRIGATVVTVENGECVEDRLDRKRCTESHAPTAFLISAQLR